MPTFLHHQALRALTTAKPALQARHPTLYEQASAAPEPQVPWGEASAGDAPGAPSTARQPVSPSSDGQLPAPGTDAPATPMMRAASSVEPVPPVVSIDAGTGAAAGLEPWAGPRAPAHDAPHGMPSAPARRSPSRLQATSLAMGPQAEDRSGTSARPATVPAPIGQPAPTIHGAPAHPRSTDPVSHPAQRAPASAPWPDLMAPDRRPLALDALPASRPPNATAPAAGQQADARLQAAPQAPNALPEIELAAARARPSERGALAEAPPLPLGAGPAARPTHEASPGAAGDPPHTVHVTIGRIEIKASTPPPTAAKAKPRTTPPALSLADYLERRHGAAQR